MLLKKNRTYPRKETLVWIWLRVGRARLMWFSTEEDLNNVIGDWLSSDRPYSIWEGNRTATNRWEHLSEPVSLLELEYFFAYWPMCPCSMACQTFHWAFPQPPQKKARGMKNQKQSNIYDCVKNKWLDPCRDVATSLFLSQPTLSLVISRCACTEKNKHLS